MKASRAAYENKNLSLPQFVEETVCNREKELTETRGQRPFPR